jgi:hypothetical protein
MDCSELDDLSEIMDDRQKFLMQVKSALCWRQIERMTFKHISKNEI